LPTFPLPAYPFTLRPPPAARSSLAAPPACAAGPPGKIARTVHASVGGGAP